MSKGYGEWGIHGTHVKDRYLKPYPVCEVNLVCFQFYIISQHSRLPRMSSSGSMKNSPESGPRYDTVP